MFTTAKKNKIISFLLITSIILPSVLFLSPKKSEALIPVADIGPKAFIRTILLGTIAGNTVTNTTISIKNVAIEVLRQITMTVVRRLLAEMTKSMTNWINSGFHGSPLFLENPESFFKDIGKYEIKTFVTLTGYDPNRLPFGKDFALNVIGSYKNKFEQNAQYSLSKAINDPVLLKRYRTDFNYGGWNAFLTNSMYPQNNYIGYQMLATEDLMRRLDGTAQNNANKVQKTLAQGMGFLSPQTCPSNPKYNNGSNEFQKPAFKTKLTWNPPDVSMDCWAESSGASGISGALGMSAQCSSELNAYNSWKANYDKTVADEKSGWAVQNTCPGGLVSTTPGSVVASQITNAMSSTFRQTELGAALGNSMSAIFDALLNKFIGSGLNALATKTNPQPKNTDDFTYEGQTLGSPDVNTTNGNNGDWSSGSDVVVTLAEMKKDVVDGINNTTFELSLMDNNAENNPGVTQMLAKIWPDIASLDMCLPGPDLGWEGRLDNEKDRNDSNIQQNISSSDVNKVNLSIEASRDLKNSVDYYKNWVKTKMQTIIPGASDYLDEIGNIDNLYQESKELSDKEKLKKDALVRLQTIQATLGQLSTQLGIDKEPESGSTEEQTLIDQKKKYNAILASISSSSTVEETRNELNTLRNRFYKLENMIAACSTARKTKGWDTKGGESSSLGDLGTERATFCDDPLVGGYSHGSFTNTGTVTHSTIPLINSDDIFKSSSTGDTDQPVNINLNCSIIYNTSPFEYKKDLP